MPSMDVTMRWESATPIQEALTRHAGQASTEETGKDSYVLVLLGLRMPEGRGVGSDDNDDTNGSDRRRAAQDPDRMRDRLMSATRLEIKGRSNIRPSDVKVVSQYGNNEVRFFFPKTNPISRDDKEILFETQLGPMKLAQKFHVKDMVYKGRLAI